MTTCIIAEKPSVARDIARIVGATSKQDGYMEGCGYVVTWAMGHLIALAMPEAYGFSAYKAEDLPIRPYPFQLVVRQVRKDKEYISDPAALKQLKVIRSSFGKADRIIVATDAGREGELVARWILQKCNTNKPLKRLWISSSTDKAIKDGFKNLKEASKYENLYNSAIARAEADWIVGINATRALTTKFNAQLSCGRVQTPTLAMIHKREEEIRNFTPREYYTLEVKTKISNEIVKFTWQDKKNLTSTFSKDKIDNIYNKIKNNLNLLFFDKNENPIAQDVLSKKFNRFLKDNDLDHIRFHDLRHSHVTLLINSKVPIKVISERVGHSNVNTTLNIYAHTLKEMDSEASDKISEVLFNLG